MVDIGGGLGIPYFDVERELDLVSLKAEITSTIESYLSEFPKTRIILESGRYLVAKSRVLVSRVIDIKLSKGEQFVVTDGGTHCHMAAVDTELFLKRNFPISVIALKPYPSQIFKKHYITGSLCTPNDLMAKQILLLPLEKWGFVLVQHLGLMG